MRTSWVLCAVAASMLTAWAGVNAYQAAPMPDGVDTTLSTASIARPEAAREAPSFTFYTVKSEGSGETCLLTRGEELSPGYARVRVTAGCEALMPGLASARFWRDNEDGSVALSSGASDPIAEFSVGDGVDYQSYAPASAMLSLKAQ